MSKGDLLFKHVLANLDNGAIVAILDFCLRMLVSSLDKKAKQETGTYMEILREIDYEIRRREGFWVT